MVILELVFIARMVRRRCLYHGCTYRDTDVDRHYKFHRLPSDAVKREEWPRRIGGYERRPLPLHAFVCSEHLVGGAGPTGNTVKPEYNALEGTGPRERSRRENVIRGK